MAFGGGEGGRGGGEMAKALRISLFSAQPRPRTCMHACVRAHVHVRTYTQHANVMKNMVRNLSAGGDESRVPRVDQVRMGGCGSEELGRRDEAGARYRKC
jgi:hypothetical protein